MSNCFFFAIYKWMTLGGYLVIRKSHWGPWWHFIWCKHLNNAEILHYVPNVKKLKFGYLHKIFFNGKIIKKDM